MTHKTLNPQPEANSTNRPGTTPPPGSDAAIERGCTCPVLDNGHGAGRHYGEQVLYWIYEDCPLHGHRSAVEPEGQ